MKRLLALVAVIAARLTWLITPSGQMKSVVARSALVLLCLLASGAGLISWQARIRTVAASTQDRQGASDNLWQAIDEIQASASLAQRATRLHSYHAVRLNQEKLGQLLSQAPMEFTTDTGEKSVMTLPIPDGTFARFQIEESPIMEPELAAQFPQMKSYKGWGLDDPTVTMRFDWTPMGLHAIIHSNQGIISVDPVAEGNTGDYFSYLARDLSQEAESFQCLVSEAQPTTSVSESQPAASRARNPAGVGFGPEERIAGANLRTYRLAIAAKSDYTELFRDPAKPDDQTAKDNAFNAIFTLVNEVNEVYRREIAVRLTLANKQKEIIYAGLTDVFRDPYPSPANGIYTDEFIGGLQQMNTAKLNAVEGLEYDIGQVFYPGGAGFAAPIGECGHTDTKGMAALGMHNFFKDPSTKLNDVGLILHEMGHQFSAHHTFNTAGRDLDPAGKPIAAYEPGSGTTIMSYGGAPASLGDAYYHAKSLDEILTYLCRRDFCMKPPPTGNTPPVVDAGPNFTIPKLTPFTLTAKGSDANGDALTYCWEEYDLGQAGPPDNDRDGQPRPIFRSFPPTPSPSRTFPQLGDILANKETAGESLPGITRAMTFRVTARDNAGRGWNAGGVSSDAMQVNVVSTSGPFVVTTPKGGETWAAGSIQTVYWDPARTDRWPISCSSVRVLLSTDGGKSFGELISNTLNNGKYSFLAPDTPTTQGRIKVEAIGNIFFDISDANFTISGCARLSRASESFGPQGGIGKINAGGCGLLARSNVDWIEIELTDLGAVTYSVRENKGAVRTGTINIGQQIFTVIQEGCEPARVTLQPKGKTVCVTGSAYFYVEATGSNRAFQWYKEDRPLPDKIANSLTISPVSLSDAGRYRVKVTSSCGDSGSVTYSDWATLSVDQREISIINQPKNVTACPGKSAAFSVNAMGTGLHYSWRRDGGYPLGIDSPTLIIDPVTPEQDGATYYVVITNSCGSVTSNKAKLSIAAAPVIVAQPADVEVCAGQQARFSVSANGDVRYQWYKDGVPITYATGRGLTIVTPRAADEGLYHAVVTNECGLKTESRKARLSLGGAVTITGQPVSVAARAGQSVTFSVAATGGNLKFKWRKNGANILGAASESSSFTIPSVSAADAGAYSVVVYNACGPAKESVAAILTVSNAALTNDSRFIIQNAPVTMVAGGRYNVSVTFRNTGASAWTAANGYKLVSQAPLNNLNWGLNEVPLPYSVAPGADVTFSFTVTAPATPGRYRFDWRVTQGTVGFGGFTPGLEISVTQ